MVRHGGGLRLGGEGVKQGGERLSTGGVIQETGGVTQSEEGGELSVVSCGLLFGRPKSVFLVCNPLLSSSSLSPTSEVCAGSWVFELDISECETSVSRESRCSDCLDGEAVSLGEDWLCSSKATVGVSCGLSHEPSDGS